MRNRLLAIVVRVCLVSLTLLLVACSGCGGCNVVTTHNKLSPEDKQAALTKANESVQDPLQIMSPWYRAGLVPDVKESKVTETKGYMVNSTPRAETITERVEPVVHTPMLNNLIYMGFILFPCIAMIVFFCEAFHTRGLFYEYGTEQTWGAFFGVLLACVGAPHIVSLIFGGLIYLGSGVVCPLFSNPHSYIPFHYAFFLVHCIMVVMSIAAVVFFYALLPLMQRSQPVNSRTSIASNTIQRKNARLRRMLIVGGKALLTGTATTLGNQFGGWLGGLLTLVASTMIVALTSTGTSVDANDNQPHRN